MKYLSASLEKFQTNKEVEEIVRKITPFIFLSNFFSFLYYTKKKKKN